MTTPRSFRSAKSELNGEGLPDETEIHKLRQYHAEIGDLLAKYETNRTLPDKVGFHVRRYLPLYAFAAIFALIVVLVPTRNQTTSGDTAGALTDGATTDDGATALGGGTGSDRTARGDASTSGGGIRSVGSVAGSGGAVIKGKKVAAVQVGKGVTRTGATCAAGVRQVTFSAYSAPCIAKFSGFNGGETYRGVTKDTIKIVVRATTDAGGPNGQAVDAANKAQGRATRAEYLQFVKQYWLPWFNKNYELYGRKVELVSYNSTRSIGTDEAQSKGKDGACADATAIAESVKAFGDLNYTTGFGESQPFAQCAKEKGGIWVPLGAAYFPEGNIKDPKGINLNGVSYKSWAPYVWGTVMQCEQISVDVAEYVGKRLTRRKAKWAGDPLYQGKNRVFGTYVPDNPGYQHCVNLTEKTLKDKYNTTSKRVDYQLDVSRFPDQAAQAVLVFQQAGVTTLINACDTLSTQLMTEAAAKQAWNPEWFIIGVATQDTDGSARSFNDDEVRGHLFGMSQLGPDIKTLGKTSEPMKAFKLANPGVAPPQGSLQAYWPLTHIFNLLQSAGPVLTPQNIQIGARRIPDGGGATGAVGTWSLKTAHTEISDSREIYWMQDKNSPIDGKAGTYVETMNGKRFRSGQWPAQEPPVYPK